MNPAQQALALLRDGMTGDDLRSLPPEQMRQFAELCYHWQQMAKIQMGKTAA